MPRNGVGKFEATYEIGGGHIPLFGGTRLLRVNLIAEDSREPHKMSSVLREIVVRRATKELADSLAISPTLIRIKGVERLQ